MAKYAFLGAPDLTELDLEAAVATCARLKGDVVAADERESLGGGPGRRALLNYGHTLAHALEVDGAFDLRHGEAVAIGLVFAARLAHRLGRVGASRVTEHRRVVTSYGLSTDVPEAYDPDRLLALMARDKKSVDGLTFVLDGPVGCEVVTGVDPAVVREVLADG